MTNPDFKLKTKPTNKKESVMTTKIKAINNSLATLANLKQGVRAALRMSSVIVPAVTGGYILYTYRADVILIGVGIALILFALYNLTVISWKIEEKK